MVFLLTTYMPLAPNLFNADKGLLKKRFEARLLYEKEEMLTQYFISNQNYGLAQIQYNI